MLRLAFLLVALIVACFAAPGERVKRYYHDRGLGYGGGGYGGGFGGYGPGQHGAGYGPHTVPVGTQSFSKSSASSTSISGGGSYGRK